MSDPMSSNTSQTARAAILGQLRAAITGALPFPRAQGTATSLPVTTIGSDPKAVQGFVERFRAEAERVRGMVHLVEGDIAAGRMVMQLLAQRQAQVVTCWQSLPIDMAPLLADAGISTVNGNMAEVAHADAGITAAACAIAATGTLVLEMGPGRPRAASLLVPVHIALVRVSQLVPRLEDYLAQQRANGLRLFEDTSNVVFITGASRTADIEMSVVYGVHGPLELHIVLIQ